MYATRPSAAWSTASLVPLDAAEDEGFESADEGRSEPLQPDFARPESAANSFSDVSLASEGRSASPVRAPSRLSRQSLAEHHAATNGHGPSDATAVPSWSRGNADAQQESAVGSLEEAIPEMLRIKDLDSGKEYNLDKASTAAVVSLPSAAQYICPVPLTAAYATASVFAAML